MADRIDEVATMPSPLAELRAAVAFLTRIPVNARADATVTTGAGAFPLVGAVLGGLAALPLAALGPSHPVVGAILAVALIHLLDGGLHLDGLADTVDALAAPPGRAEAARTDPRVGSAGAAGIVLTLGLEIAAAAELAGRGAIEATAALVVAGAVSRGVIPALATTVGRRRRPEAGLGAWFADRVGSGAALIALGGVAMVIAAAAGATSPALVVRVAAGTAASVALVLSVLGARGQLDGDGYGFATEAAFAIVLVACAVMP